MELYKNLKFLKTYEGNVLDLGLNFTMVADASTNTELELIPNGK